MEVIVEIVGFQDAFTDALHHRKEEKFLFPAAVEVGCLKKEDFDHLFEDHEKARKHIKTMTELIKGKDLEPFYKEAGQYVEMMLHHIHHEEDVFFPQIEECISSDLDTAIFKQFGDYLEQNFAPTVYSIAESFANRAQDEILGPGFFEAAH